MIADNDVVKETTTTEKEKRKHHHGDYDEKTTTTTERPAIEESGPRRPPKGPRSKNRRPTPRRLPRLNISQASTGFSTQQAIVLRDTYIPHSEIRYQPYFSSICFWYNREVLAIVCSPFLLSEFDPRAISGSVLFLEENIAMIAFSRSDPAKGSEKREKPVSPMAPHPQSELHPPQSRAFDRNLERLCRERRKTIASYQKLLEKWRSPVGPESVLPLPKNLIAAAISQESWSILPTTGDLNSKSPTFSLSLLSRMRNIGFFPSSKTPTNLHWSWLLREEPANLLRRSAFEESAGDSAVRIQRRISWKMRCRLKQIRKLCA